MSAAQRIQLPRGGLRRGLLRDLIRGLLASLIAAPFALAQAVPDAVDTHALPQASWEILAVDRQGRPVADVELELIDTMSTAVTRPMGGTRHATDENGTIGGVGEPPYVLEIVSRDPRWSVAFIHAVRVEDEELGDDLLGRPLLRIDTLDSVVCVLEPTGTIHVRVIDAGSTDRFHVCFVDDRPEPASHRIARASASFDGAEGRLTAPAGRGTLYVARDGSLGSPILANGRPLLVAVVPGRTTEVELRFFDGPTTTLMAPFGTIPFEHLEALTPDGKTVVADLPFLSSPLRIPFALPVAGGTPHDPQHPIGFRLPKHLIRAADIPTPAPLERAGTDEVDPLRPKVETAPIELIFTVDLGSKVRLPEVSAGWTTLVRGGLMVLGGSGSTGPLLGNLRDAPGRVDLAPLYRASVEASDPWSVTVHVFDGDAAPAAFREVLISTDRVPALRAMTDARGAVHVSGILGETVTAAAFHSQGERIAVPRGPEEEGAPAHRLTLGTATRGVRGRWTVGEAGAVAPGSVLVLVPADAEEAAARRAFGTRAYQIAITDARGSFEFGEVPCGDYVLRTNSGNEHALSVASDEEGAVVLSLRGSGPEATLETGR